MTDDTDLAMPSNTPCSKCGGSDIYRRFFPKGEDTNGIAPNRKGVSTKWVDRKDAYYQKALKDCIVHKCRCCGYSWDADPLKETTP